MLAVARRAVIKEIVQEQKNVTVSELSQRFGVTDETIRRDLKALADEHFLIRTYGGAYIESGVQNDIDVAVRKELYVGIKEQLARQCAGMISHGDCVFLDASTTSYHIAQRITNMRVTVITNSLHIAGAISSSKSVKLVMIGGILDKNSQSFLGRSAAQFLEKYYADKAFISCRSVSLENGLTDSNEQQAELRSLAIQRCNSAHLVVDHTKLDKTSFASICGFSSIKSMVCDAALDSRWRERLIEDEVEIYDQIQ